MMRCDYKHASLGIEQQINIQFFKKIFTEYARNWPFRIKNEFHLKIPAST